MTQRISEFSLSLPITQAARRKAQEFASQQPTPEKAAQVRLNTLAVMVMHDYLELMDIPTNLAASDSWNGITRLCADVADLELPEHGRLECRPVGPEADSCPVPPETWEDRVGYVVVEVDEASASATLLGFVPQVSTEELALDQLRSPEDLLDHLHIISQPAPEPEQVLANLGQWLNQVFETGWQTVEEILGLAQLQPAYAFRFRGPTRRAKTLDLSPELTQPIALIVEVTTETTPQNNEQMIVKLQLQAIDDQPLPVQINLAILNEVDEVIVTGQSSQILEVKGVSGERFSFRVTFNDTQITQVFVI